MNPAAHATATGPAERFTGQALLDGSTGPAARVPLGRCTVTPAH
ncbi:protein of unknown function [Micropruina glycogenica]|uniref:Uncharacterized protein n=1 Tax=Micropruina glycogenica TaxID=75385 RepID=A0A2N9JBU5_9ACTN|nr:protein of unknown function [Micropruina glycogenica]